mgnify:CR=1 FL=1
MRDKHVTGVPTCALPILRNSSPIGVRLKFRLRRLVSCSFPRFALIRCEAVNSHSANFVENGIDVGVDWFRRTGRGRLPMLLVSFFRHRCKRLVYRVTPEGSKNCTVSLLAVKHRTALPSAPSRWPEIQDKIS